MSLVAYPIILQQDKYQKGYQVQVPDIPGILAYGRTEQEAISNTQDEIKVMIPEMNYFPEPSLKTEIKIEPNAILAMAIVDIQQLNLY